MDFTYMIQYSKLYLSVLFCLASFHFSYFATAAGNETDRLALLAFKAKITDDPFGVLQSWNESDIHFCRWHGVACGRLHQRITKLDLASSKLSGSISPSIGNLSFLRVLYLENNSFSYHIPPQISNLRRVKYLWLHNNSLTGSVPRNLSACSNLHGLRLSHNMVDGEIPVDLGSLSKLSYLHIDHNSIAGEIPSSLGNLSFLSVLYLSFNNLDGRIPSTLGQLTNLEEFLLASNRLTGTIPSLIFNLSYIFSFDVQLNQLHGVLPSYLGDNFPKLKQLGISGNQFTGSIPVSLSNASELVTLIATENNLTGEVPNFGNSVKLSWLVLSNNQLGHGGKFNDLAFFSALRNCTDLSILALNDNNFGGTFPSSFLNLSTTLTAFLLFRNHVSGQIPEGIGKFVNLNNFLIASNRLSGEIPSDIGLLKNLQELGLDENHLTGIIPSSLGNLSLVIQLDLAVNRFHGNIPFSLGKCQSLIALDLSDNNLSGLIPPQIFGLSTLSKLLDLSRNLLIGSLPDEVGQLQNLGELYLEYNMLTGRIPSTLASCVRLEVLTIQDNSFQGTIPSSMSALRGLQYLDLASNNISGLVPKFFGEFKFQYLNLSFNDFEGEFPMNGVLKNASVVSVDGNERLCGGVPELKLPLCKSNGSKKRSSIISYKFLVPMILGPLGLTIVLCSLLFCWLKRKKLLSSLESPDYALFRVSYRDLVKATDGFSSANMIGFGAFGSVYRGVLDDGIRVAIKVLNLEHHAAARSFIAECEALKNIRHRNLVKVLTACSGIDYQGNDFKAIIYELMVNGSLDGLLHPVLTEDEGNDNQPLHSRQEDERQEHKSLNLDQRLNIAIDVASALDYLHNHCGRPIIHCDLKPSNILLDGDMVAHVGDFGLAKVIPQIADPNITSSDGIRGTTGYTAPEYGLGSRVSTKGDVYSYGILVLEIITGKRPTDPMFVAGLNLHSFGKISSPDKVLDKLDPVLVEEIVATFDKETRSESAIIGKSLEIVETLGGASSNYNRSRNEKKMKDCLVSMLKIGVACSMESPVGRMNMKSVVQELQSIEGMLQ